jgi:hypothetical protein
MRVRAISILVLVIVLPLVAVTARATSVIGPDLSTFAILGGAGVTIDGTGSVITGSVGGCCNATAVTGVIPTNFTISGGTVQKGGGTAIAAQGQLGNAIFDLGLLGPGTLESVNLGGLTLSPGVYTVPAGTTNLTGTLTLDGGGHADAAWVFQLPSTLITSPGSLVKVINTGGSLANVGVFWNVGSSATLDGGGSLGSTFAGIVLANQSIQLTGAGGVTDNCGALYTQVASVTLAGKDVIGIGCNGGLTVTDIGGGGVSVGGGGIPAVTPEPGTFALLSSGLALGFLKRCKLR